MKTQTETLYALIELIENRQRKILESNASVREDIRIAETKEQRDRLIKADYRNRGRIDSLETIKDDLYFFIAQPQAL